MKISWEYRNSNLRFSTRKTGKERECGSDWGTKSELCEVLRQIF
jgi:hypothetical protein